MRNIIIVECRSTGINYIQDILNRNCTPILLDMKLEENEDSALYRKMVEISKKSINIDCERLQEKDTYEETLEMVREYDPLLVIPGSERGVRLATQLANDLNLKCNPIENLDAMTLKDKMQERLKEKGLRHIRGRTIKTIQEAIDFYDEEELKEVVIKPIYSAGSVGVRICANKQEMVDSLKKHLNKANFYGDKTEEYLIQECINGNEYVVNTVSCEGVHRVTTVWKYHKLPSSVGGQMYNFRTSVNEFGLGEVELIEYAYKVCDAMGIRYGPVHGEYMIDENGPVLIEVNCRPMGSSMDAKYLDRLSGQHETDSSLDSYLNPDKFDFEMKKGYNLYEYGAIKFFIIPNDILAQSNPMIHISNKLKTHYMSFLDEINECQPYIKTQDLETTGGAVFLIHPNAYEVKKDIDFLISIEKNASQLVLSDGSHKKTELVEDETYDDVKYLLNLIHAYGTILFITDQIFEENNIMQVNPKEIDEINGEYDCVVVNLNESIVGRKDDDVVSLFLKIIDKVKVGGLIFIPPSTYQYTANGRLGAEALVRALDLKLQLPLHSLMGFVIASKG